MNRLRPWYGGSSPINFFDKKNKKENKKENGKKGKAKSKCMWLLSTVKNDLELKGLSTIRNIFKSFKKKEKKNTL